MQQPYRKPQRPYLIVFLIPSLLSLTANTPAQGIIVPICRRGVCLDY